MFKQFRYPTNRQALMAAIASAALLITFVVLWLGISTRTALLSQELDKYDSQQEQITNDTNLLWKQIGEVTAPQEMDRRMRDAGFQPPEGVEYLVPAAATTALSTTLPITGGIK